jgi:hypothetical protein
MNTLNTTFTKKRLSVIFAITFFVVLILNLISCPLGLMVSSYMSELTVYFHNTLTTGRLHLPYILSLESLAVTVAGIAAGLVFWVVSLVPAYFFQIKIIKPLLWLTTTIASFCFGLWYYFLIPDVIAMSQNNQHFMLFITHGSISGFIIGGTQWLYVRANIPKSSLWIVSTIVCYLLSSALVFWIAPEN